jgi:uncharacterized Zn finger protein (UPF0148 family)
MAQQIPILCAQCGGATTPRDDGTLACPFCGHQDRLPDDQLGRALELKRRVTAAANGVAQLRGMESALGHIFESRGAFVRAAGPWLVLAPLILAYSLVSSWPHIEKAPPEFRAGLIANALMGPMFLAGILLAIFIAMAIGRLHYRRKVRPLMFARSPRAPGMPVRCRACGGDLPDRRGPFIVCDFCRTHNLVTPEVQRHDARLLEDEHRFHRDRAHQLVAQTARGSLHMGRTMVIGIVLAYAGMIGLAYLATSLFPSG